MKFINYLEKIIGVDIYALSSFSIFFTFFLLMTLWAWKADKKMIEEISQLPLDN
nr:CcoQ/FixQ family Cbb3-type cytochrome c oxidase assembly chaperone [uncultured Sediminibacterium sp.]